MSDPKELLRDFAKDVDKQDPVKPAYKTTEFYIKLIVVLVGMTMASGAFSKEISVQVIGGLAATLSAISYQLNRTSLKKLGLKVLETFIKHGEK